MKRLAIFLMLFFILTIPAGITFAASPSDRVMESGEEHDGDLVIFSDNLIIETGAQVDGDVTIFSGNATIAGEVDGDVVLFSGNLTLDETASIDGDCVLLSGNVTANGNVAACTILSGPGNFHENFPENFLTEAPSMPNLPPHHPHPEGGGSSILGNLLEAVVSAFVVGLLALFVALIAPTSLTQVRETAETNPVVSGGVGILTTVAVPSLAAILAPISAFLVLACGLGLLGIPIILGLIVGLIAGTLLGWVALGMWFGEWLTKRFGWPQRGIATTAVMGTVALTFVVNLLPFVGDFVGFVVMCVGLGAVTLTQFGSKPYPRIVDGITIDEEKVSTVLDTLPVEDVDDLKNSG